MADDALISALLYQAAGCEQFGSAFYADFLKRAASDLRADLRLLLAPWQDADVRTLILDAVPLRLLGGLHDLVLDGAAPELAAAFPPNGDAEAAWAAARGAFTKHGRRLADFITHEPQTNEVRRSACLLPGFLIAAEETGLPLRCLELGASAGLNQFWSRFHYDYGDAGAWGDPAAQVRLDAEWRGAAPPPLAAKPLVAEIAACDRKPIDLTDPVQRRRLVAYVWPDQPERIERLNAAIDVALAAGVQVEAADAADWTIVRAAPQAGVLTVLYHSIFWQYLPAERAQALRAAIEAHGAAATREAPFAWLSMEGGANPTEIALRLTLWPGGEERHLAMVHAHGASVEWQ